MAVQLIRKWNKWIFRFEVKEPDAETNHFGELDPNRVYMCFKDNDCGPPPQHCYCIDNVCECDQLDGKHSSESYADVQKEFP